MLCQQCGQRPASFHLTKVVNGEKSEAHLCEVCAQQQGGYVQGLGPAFSIHQLLAGLLNYPTQFTGLPDAGSPGTIVCRDCGLTYEDFAHTGRLGCGRCYEEFQPMLEPLMRRIHGAVQHTGKTPARTGKQVAAKREIVQLRADLQDAISREDFERAARLRDRIRALEQKDAGNGG